MTRLGKLIFPKHTKNPQTCLWFIQEVFHCLHNAQVYKKKDGFLHALIWYQFKQVYTEAGKQAGSINAIRRYYFLQPSRNGDGISKIGTAPLFIAILGAPPYLIFNKGVIDPLKTK